MTAQEKGRLGGQAVVRKYGREHMAKIGRAGFDARVARYWEGNEALFVWYLTRMGLAAQDPVPENGAWQQVWHLRQREVRA